MWNYEITKKVFIKWLKFKQITAFYVTKWCKICLVDLDVTG